MKPLPFVVALLVVVPLAGCIGSNGDGTTDRDADCVGPLDLDGIRIVGTDHDPLANRTVEDALAFDFEATNLRTCSLTAIGHAPLHPDGTPHKYLGEIDMRGDLDLGAVAVLGNREDPRIYLLDISDRADPQVISWIDETNTYIVDVKISDDGALLFAASQNIPLDPELEGLPVLNAPTGFSIYDISDPSAPRYLNTVVDPAYGCHMMSHEIIDGTDYLFCISNHVRIFELERLADTVVSVGFTDYIYEDEMGIPRPGPPIIPVGLPDEVAPVRNAIFGQFTDRPHDVTVTRDVVTDQVIGVVSHWNAGLHVIDVSDPKMIQQLGVWNGEGATHYDGNVHTAMMFYVGDDRYIMASPEYTYGGQVPSLWVLDANDYSDLKLVAEWYHPGEHPSQGLFMTIHQWQVAPTGPDANVSDVRIYMTYNHAGVWVLDFEAILAGDNQAAILGFNMARNPVEDPDPIPAAIYATWDVNVVDGYIYGSDRATGLWVFHYAGDPLGDPRYTGFA